jgi:hypothetical protein
VGLSHHTTVISGNFTVGLSHPTTLIRGVLTGCLSHYTTVTLGALMVGLSHHTIVILGALLSMGWSQESITHSHCTARHERVRTNHGPVVYMSSLFATLPCWSPPPPPSSWTPRHWISLWALRRQRVVCRGNAGGLHEDEVPLLGRRGHCRLRSRLDLFWRGAPTRP